MSIEKDYLITKMKLLKFTLIIVSQGKKAFFISLWMKLLFAFK